MSNATDYASGGHRRFYAQDENGRHSFNTVSADAMRDVFIVVSDVTGNEPPFHPDRVAGDYTGRHRSDVATVAL